MAAKKAVKQAAKSPTKAPAKATSKPQGKGQTKNPPLASAKAKAQAVVKGKANALAQPAKRDVKTGTKSTAVKPRTETITTKIPGKNTDKTNPQIEKTNVKTVPPKSSTKTSEKPVAKASQPEAVQPAKKAVKASKSKEKTETKPSPESGIVTGQKGDVEKIIKKLIAKGKERGFLTYDEINNSLPAGEFSSDQIEDSMTALTDSGVQLVDSADDISEDEAEEKPEKDEEEEEEYESRGNISADDTGRTDDPVRMYLREMGSVELLSREGEIAIAKRIEAGRETMIGGICESPLAIESIIAWYEALQRGDILLREVIDLEATYGGENTAFAPGFTAPAAPAAKEEAAEKPEGEAVEGGEGAVAGEEDENSVSLAAMEAELAPKVFPIFENIKKKC